MRIENNLKGQNIQKQPKLKVAPMKIENNIKGHYFIQKHPKLSGSNIPAF